jgi:hypothetical protein
MGKKELLEARKQGLTEATKIQLDIRDEGRTVNILELTGKFVGKDVTDLDLVAPKTFAPPIRGAYTPEQWQKRREQLLKVKLP